MDESAVHDAYTRLLEYCRRQHIEGNFLAQTLYWQQGYWRTIHEYLRQSRIADQLKNATVVDMGSKYGHAIPLLSVLGAKSICCVDVDDSYLETGKRVFERLYDNLDYVKSDQGLIPLQPEIADVVLSVEILSHSNQRYTPVIYDEYSRILKDDGALLISDSNNLACPGYFEDKLVEFYRKYENGPDGTILDNGQPVEQCFRTLRRQIIAARHPGLGDEDVEYLAANTSSLFGDLLAQEVDRYVRTGALTRRPYRAGICPTNPGESGCVIEQGLYPEQIILALRTLGLSAYYLQREQHALEGLESQFAEGSWFTIVAVKHRSSARLVERSMFPPRLGNEYRRKLDSLSLEIAAAGHRTAIVCGAAPGGCRTAAAALGRAGIDVLAFTDRTPEQYGGTVNGLRVLGLLPGLQLAPSVAVIGAVRHAQEIQEEIRALCEQASLPLPVLYTLP